jgi:uncharacterized repeat protein (TIGR01451 family)
VKTGSPTKPKPGDVVRYDLTLHVTGNTAYAVTLTDDLPNGLVPSTLVFVSGPVGTVTGTHLSWVLGTMTAPSDVTVSFTVQVDLETAGDSVLRNVGHATSTSAGTADTWADIKVLGDVQMTMSVYNEAGEVVKSFPMKYLSKSVNNMDVTSDGLLSSVGGSVTMVWDGGRVLAVWDGTGNDGQLVANGSYYVKVDSVDAYGTTTSVTKPLTVNRPVSNVELVVYNQAGEVVRHLASTWAGPIENITVARLTATVISPTYGPSQGVTETSVMSGSAVLGVWDGRNDSGVIVDNGQYYIELKVQDGKAGNATLDLSVAVMSDRSGGGTMVVKPNVLTREVPIGTIDGGVLGGTVDAKVFSLTGSLVGNLTGVPGAGTVTLDSRPYASGMYIVFGDVRTGDGKLMQTFRTKVLVVR